MRLRPNARRWGKLVAELKAALDAKGIAAFSKELPTLKEASNLLIGESLRRAGGEPGAASLLLGLTRTALNRRLNKKA